MRTYLRISLALGVASLLSCAVSSPTERFVRQRIPVELQKGAVVTIHVSTTGENEVGVRCNPELWRSLTNGSDNISSRLLSFNKKEMQISKVAPGGNRTWSIQDYHFLFYIGGEMYTKASIEISFPNGPSVATPAEIIVCKSTSDFGP